VDVMFVYDELEVVVYVVDADVDELDGLYAEDGVVVVVVEEDGGVCGCQEVPSDPSAGWRVETDWGSDGSDWGLGFVLLRQDNYYSNYWCLDL
jgi:hypothetical protein